jgi:HTH-type transcriptional regulator/antitoxin HigA
MNSFIVRKQPFISHTDINSFSKIVKVHPGLVAGQVRALTNDYSKFAKYLVKVRQYLMKGTNIDGWGEVYPSEL